VGDEDERQPERVAQLLEKGEDLRLDGDVEARRRFVREHEQGLRRDAGRRDHDALHLALAELERVVRALLRVDADTPQHRHDLFVARLAADLGAVQPQDPLELRVDADRRVQRVHGILEDDADRPARSSRSRAGVAPSSSSPAKTARPLISLERGSSPMSARSTVDLPEPLSPTIPTDSPGSTENDTLRNAGRLPCAVR